LFLFADHIASNGDPQFIGKDAASAMFPPGCSLAPGYSNEAFRNNVFFTNGKHENPVGISNALADENEVRDPFAFAEAGYEGMLTEKIRLSAKAYYDYKSQDFTYEVFDQQTSAFFGYPKDQGIIGYPQSKSDKIGSELMMTFNLHNSAEMVAGALFESLKIYDVKSCR